MSHHLGLDVGGTHIRAAVATGNTNITGTSTGLTPRNSDGGAITDEILRIAERACENAGVDTGGIDAIGIGAIGPIDREAGAVIGPANVFGPSGRIALVEPLHRAFRPDSVVLHNDAICGVIAEHHFSDSTTENMVYLTISTGIGAGIVVDGNVIFGHRGNAAEVGHTTIDPMETMECGCGRAGHWEAYCGGANIPDYAAHLHRHAPVETSLPITREDFTAKDVLDEVGEDPLADLLVERIGRWNTIGVANVIQAFAPTYISVGGAVALNNPETILDPIRTHVSDRVFIDVPEIGVAETGEEAVLRGALLIARR